MNKLKLLTKISALIPIASLIIALNCPTVDPSPATLSISKTEKIALDNGLTLLLKQVSGSEVTSLIALIKSGSSQEGEFLGSGIAHLLEHMFFKDDPEQPKSEIAKQISLLGGEINGSTSYDWTYYSIILPKENLEAALELLRTFLLEPKFKPEDLEREKEVVLKEINLKKDNPSRELWEILMQTSFLKHPYRYPIIGHADLLKTISLDNLKEYYRRTYGAENIILSIAGDFDKQRIKDKTKELFGQHRRGLKGSACYIREPPQTSMREIVKEIKTSKLAYTGLGYRSISIHHRDLYALDALAAVLGSGRSSRLNQRLKEEKKIVYSIGAINYTPIDPGLFVVTFTCEPEDQQKAKSEILTEIENIKKKGITIQELKKVKQSIKSDFLFSQAKSQHLAVSAAQNEAALGNPDFDKTYVARIETLKVKDIQEAAIKYLNSSNLTSAALIPESKEDNRLKEKEAKNLKREIKHFELDTGIDALLLEDARLPLVNIRIAFLGGLLAETEENNGISYLTSKLLLKGTKTKSAYDIARRIESWGGNIDSFSGNNSFGISLNILKENLSEALKLISQIILTPAFSPQEIAKEKKLAFGRLKKQKEDIFTIGSLLLKSELYKDYPYSMNAIGKISSIEMLTRKDIIEFYNRQTRGPNMVISVFGDIDNKHTLKLIKSLFAPLNPKGTAAITAEKLEPLNRNMTQFEILKKEQSLFLLGFRTVSLKNTDKYTLAIISEVLSGLDGRLFKNIRASLGIAYTLGAYNSSLLKGGHFIFYVATTEENLKKAQEKIWQEIEELKQKSITTEELERAKKSLIGKKKISLETLPALSWQASLDNLYGLGFENYKNYANQINKITTPDVGKALNKYFNANFVEVFVSPSSFLSDFNATSP